MKRSLRSALLALVLLLSQGPSAVAAFESDSIVQVVYKSDDVEVATDLLHVNVDDLNRAHRVLAGPGNVGLSQFVSTEDWGDLRIGMFGFDGTYAYLATDEPTAPSVERRSWGSFLGAADAVLSHYAGLATGPTVVGLPTDFNSYWVKMDSGTTPGQYAGLNVDHGDGEASLDPLHDPDGFVEMFLYKFERDPGTRDVVLVPGPAEAYSAVLRISGDGSTVLNPVDGFQLLSPENGASAGAPPVLEWAPGDFDLFQVYLVLPIFGSYYTIPVWVYGVHQIDLAGYGPLWNYVTANGWCAWAVLGVSTTTWQVDVAGPWWVRKAAP